MFELANEITVFLGAGASVPIGIPDSKMLVDKIQKALWRHSDRIEQIRQKIKDFGLVDDIEAVLSCLTFWSNPSETIKASGSFLAEIVNTSINSFEAKNMDAVIATRIKEYIVRLCFIYKADDITQITKLYRPFFEGLCRKFHLQECNPKGRHLCPPIDVFTTNYDNVIEAYARTNGIPAIEGTS
jgi:hypothetical protein